MRIFNALPKVAVPLAILLATPAAHAAIVGLQFNGVFDDDEYYQIVQTPFSYSGYLAYDSATAPQSINGSSATYVSNLGFAINEFSFLSSQFTIKVMRAGADAYLSFTTQCQFPAKTFCADMQFVHLANYAGLALPSDAALFTGQSFNLTLTHLVLDPWGNYMGDRDSNYGPGTFAAVPEPGTWAMLVLGLGSIGAISRYRRRVAGRVASA